MRTLIRPDLAHKSFSRHLENRVIPGDLGYAQWLCVPHANLSELAVPRINAGRVLASKEEVSVINQRQHHDGRSNEKPSRLYGGSNQRAGGRP